MPGPQGNKNAAGNKGGGRKTTYKPEYVAQAVKACEAGFTDRELAALFGVSETTINQWKLDHVEFAEALKAGKAVADERVERSLYHRAIGYSFESEKVFHYQGAIVRTPVTEHVPPDTTACIFWLKNRRRDEWRDKQEHEHTGKDGGPIETRVVTDEERVRALAAFLAKMKVVQASSRPPTDV